MRYATKLTNNTNHLGNQLIKMKIIIYSFLMCLTCLLTYKKNIPTFNTLKTIIVTSKLHMGWNSWDCFGTSVIENEVKSNANYIAKDLKEYGLEYVVDDIDCYGLNLSAHNTRATYYKNPKPHHLINEFGFVITAANKYPSCKNGNFKPLANWLSAKSLKFGFQIKRGIPWEAVKKNTLIKGTTYHAYDIVKLENSCDWYDGTYDLVDGKLEIQELYYSIYKQFATWGVDFVKVDDISLLYNAKDIEAVRKEIDLSSSSIVLILYPGSAPYLARNHLQKYANMFLMSVGFWDTWQQLKNQFALYIRWSLNQKLNQRADFDMLSLGKLSIMAEIGYPRQTNLTKPEQITIMTLWSIFNSLLLLSGNLPDNHNWTNSLITNEEVLAVNQLCKPPKLITAKSLLTVEEKTAYNSRQVLSADDKSKYVAFFNLTDSAQKISVGFNQLMLSSSFTFRNLWAKKIWACLQKNLNRLFNRMEQECLV